MTAAPCRRTAQGTQPRLPARRRLTRGQRPVQFPDTAAGDSIPPPPRRLTRGLHQPRRETRPGSERTHVHLRVTFLEGLEIMKLIFQLGELFSLCWQRVPPASLVVGSAAVTKGRGDLPP